MLVQTMAREAWTDERLDDLNAKVDMGFARVDARFDRFETSVDSRFDKIDARFDRLESRFDGLNRTLIAGLVVIVAALIGGIVT